MSTPSPKIFIVEDEAVICLTIEHTLKRLGYTVAGTAHSGEDCLARLEKVRPDLVLMDIQLDGKLDGIETASIIRERYGYPVVFLTAYSDKEILRRASITEPFGYLVKPFNEKDLHSTIEISINRASLYRKIRSSERKFRDIAGSIDEIVLEIDVSGKFRYLNPYGAAILGIDPENYSALNFLDYVVRQDARSCLKKKMRLSSAENPKCQEVRVLSGNGRVLFFREQLKPVVEDGKVTGLRGILVNITTTRYKQALQQAITELSDLLREDNITYDGFVFYIIKLIKTLTGANSVYFNKYDPETKSIFTYERTSPKEIGRQDERKLTKWVVKSQAPLFLQGEQLTKFLVKNKISRKEIQARSWMGIPIQIGTSVLGVLVIQSFESDKFLLEEDFSIFKDCAHEISFVFQSISFKTKARQNEFQYRNLVETINEGIIQVSFPGNTLLFANHKLAEMLEIDPAVLKPGTPLEDLYFVRQNSGSLYGVIFDRQQVRPGKYELQVVTRSGKEKWFLVSATLLHNEKGAVTGSMGVWLDVTEKRENEQRIRESSERLNEIVKNIKEAFWLIDWRTKKLLYTSPSFETIYGTTPEAINAGENLWFDLLHPDDAFIRDYFFVKGPKGGYDAEFRLRTSDGSLKWVHERAFPIHDGQGRVIKMTGYSMNISDRKLAELELAQSESNKKAIIHAIPDSLLTVSGAGVIQDSYLKASTGLLTHNMPILGEKFTSLFNRNKGRRLQSEFRKFLVAPGVQPVNMTVHDNTIGKWLELRFAHIDKTNKLILIRDVTGSKKQEAELKKFFNIIEQSEEIILITDKSGAIEYTNPKFSQVSGYEMNEVVGKTPAILNSGKHSVKFFKDFWSTILSGNSFNGEIINCKKNGDIYIEEKFVSPLFNESGEIVNYISTGRDITEKRNTEQKLEAYRRLQEFQEKKQMRIRTLSLLQGQEEERKRIARELHDGLGQILSATKLYLEKIGEPDKTFPDSDFSKVHQMVIETIHEVRRISNDLSPSGLHDFGLHAAVRNLVSKVGDSVNFVRFSINSNLNQLRFKSNVEINVFRIIQEAINNAVKHSKATKIEINLLYTELHMRVSVMDNGVGFEIPQKGAPQSQSGNGLANMRERAKIIGGKLLIVAEKNCSSLISFELKTHPIKK